MKTSELIKELKKSLQLNGDVPVKDFLPRKRNTVAEPNRVTPFNYADSVVPSAILIAFSEDL